MSSRNKGAQGRAPRRTIRAQRTNTGVNAMPRNSMFRAVAMTALFSVLGTQANAQATPDWSATDRALGRAGAEQPGNVHKFAFPRSDLSVTLKGTQLRPALALGSWL